MLALSLSSSWKEAQSELVATINLKGREAGATTDLVALALDLILALAPKDGEAGATTNLVALALDLIFAFTPEDGEAGAATDLSALALYLRGVTALNVTPH